MIIFELDDRRFAIDWNVTELNQKPADVIPIRKKAPGEKQVTPPSRQNGRAWFF